MAGNPTPGHTTSRQPWALSSSPPAFLFPTPSRETQHFQEMPPPDQPTMARKKQKPCDISNLMSPPEPAPLDQCRATETASGKVTSPTGGETSHLIPSPPISPEFPTANTVDSASSQDPNAKDPILYPSDKAPASAPTGPLFAIESTISFGSKERLEQREIEERLVSEHIASRPAELFREASPPKREDYHLAIYLKSNCFRMFKENPGQWLRQERQLLRADRKHTALPPQSTKLPRILPASKPAVRDPQTAKAPAVRIQKPKTTKVKAANPRPIRATPAASRETARISLPEPRTRTVAPNREDKDFAAFEDISPPVSTLPAKGNSLKVDWKGNALDLSNDPNRDLLHPDELILASNLRLDCATYLTSKRRIFLRRLECAKIPKEFRKTDAQQACKIDVNKASKLWQAYERVGWLDLKWMREYI